MLGAASVAGTGTVLGARPEANAAASQLNRVQAAQLSTQVEKLTASDAAADQFGRSVSVSVDGSTALVGAGLNDDAGSRSGSAYVYDLTASPPTETKLTAGDAAEGDEFGISVSVSADGSTALVGALHDDDAGSDSGSAYVFELTDSAVFPEPIPLKNGMMVTPVDGDGDGLTEDLDGDGDVDGQDIALLTQLENAYRKGGIQLTDAQVAALDFDGDGWFTKADISAYDQMYDL